MDNQNNKNKGPNNNRQGWGIILFTTLLITFIVMGLFSLMRGGTPEEISYDKFLKLIDESGTSSWELLQNCYSLQNCHEQKISLMLALTQLFLNKIQGGICRVHGGGFAGVIATILPEAEMDNYVEYISRYVGRDNVYPMDIRAVGAAHIG